MVSVNNTPFHQSLQAQKLYRINDIVHMWLMWHAMHSTLPKAEHIYKSNAKLFSSHNRIYSSEIRLLFKSIIIIDHFPLFGFCLFLLDYYKIFHFYCVWQWTNLQHFTGIGVLRIWLVVFRHRRAMHVVHLRNVVWVVALALAVLYRQFEHG